VRTIRVAAGVSLLVALVMPAAAQQPIPADSDVTVTTPSGQVVLGTIARWDSADQATLILVLGGKPTRWQLAAAKAPAPTPVPQPLSALAAEVRDLAVQTVPVAERQTHAAALAAAYRGVSGRIKSGELKALAEKIKAAKPGTAADLSPLSDQIADGLEACR
jgi:hypothetical protein